jgi:dTDP-4-amino-4,6-dideoxygalactose transaminase
VALFWKGRVALYALLKALGVREGDEVVIPAFTCVVVPNAVMYAGAVPVYADIDVRTLTVDSAQVARRVTAKTRVVLAQNTFGLPADLERLSDVLKGSGIALLDDACHGLGSEHCGARLSPKVSGAFYSAQWSKPISAGLGGIAVSANPDTAWRLRALEGKARPPRALQVVSLALLRIARDTARHRVGHEQMRSAYHALTRLGMAVPSSDPVELALPTMPDGFQTRMAPSQASVIRQSLSGLPDRIEKRRQIARYYDALLANMGKQQPVEPGYARHGYLRYPLMSSDRSALLSAARHSGVELGDWFVSPLHPVLSGLERWHYVAGSCPVAEQVAARIVNLSTDPHLRASDLRAVGAFLADHRELIDSRAEAS